MRLRRGALGSRGHGPGRRRETVARLVRTGHISTQDELLRALRASGFTATQATLSRDLARLGARRASEPGGGTRYELSAEEVHDGLESLRRLVTSIACNGSLVVVRTVPGGAPAVARAIDLAELEDALGSIAGDDTVFVAPTEVRSARALARAVERRVGGSPPRPSR
ncbi:MAG TPA: arginine repressor [Anaeromyxobacteraceae bacterium]|nr:arginine repressor [Anaeromyxobacteraceae bacterium]